MNDIAMFEAKNRLSELIHRVEAGEDLPAEANPGTEAALQATATLDVWCPDCGCLKSATCC